MNDLAYSGINTTVRILEQQLLSKDISFKRVTSSFRSFTKNDLWFSSR